MDRNTEPRYTENLHLKLPRGSKYWNYDTWNENMKILDEHSRGLTPITIELPMNPEDVRFVPNQDTITATNVKDAIDQLAESISIVKYIEVTGPMEIVVNNTGHEYFMIHFGNGYTNSVTFVGRDSSPITWLNGQPRFEAYTTYEISFLRLNAIWAKRSDVDYSSLFYYTIENDKCYVTGVDLAAWYEQFNNYDIYLPEKIMGYPTVIRT